MFLMTKLPAVEYCLYTNTTARAPDWHFTKHAGRSVRVKAAIVGSQLYNHTSFRKYSQKVIYLKTFLTEMLELSAFVVHTFGNGCIKCPITHCSSGLVMLLISSWILCYRSSVKLLRSPTCIISTLSISEIYYTDYGLLCMKSFLHLRIKLNKTVNYKLVSALHTYKFCPLTATAWLNKFHNL